MRLNQYLPGTQIPGYQVPPKTQSIIANKQQP